MTTRLFVEAFKDREAFLEILNKEFGETDALEKQRISGTDMRTPGGLYGDDKNDQQSDMTA